MNRTPTLLGFMNRKFTYQETLDYIEQKLHEQGKTSYNVHEELCTYRGDDGTRCGIGHIITDKQYTPSIEWSGIEDSIQCLTPMNYGIENPRLKFLSDIQSAHDHIDHDLRSAAFRSCLHRVFSEIRKEYNLTPFKAA